MDALSGVRIVVTGVTGQVAEPVARALAADNEVYGAARFGDTAARERLEAAGVRCVRVDLASGNVTSLPADADYVLNFAVSKSNDWGADLDANAGGVASLLEHHQAARAFLHCSSTAVYQPNGHHPFAEDDPLGDNHRVVPFLETYSISKIAAEAAARWGARRFGVATTIARLNVPYGDNGGWPDHHLQMMQAGMAVPVHTDAPSEYQPIHEQDIIAMLPALLSAATVPATVVNWAGEDVVSIEDWCRYLSELTGLPATFAPTAQALESVRVDLERLHSIGARAQVGWRDGLRRMVQVRHPDLLRAPAS